VIFSLVALAFPSLFSCSAQPYSGLPESVSLAYSAYPETALYWIAQDQQFFGRNGLNVSFHKYDAIAPAMDAMANGQVDVVGNVTEFPIVGRAFQNASVATIACVAESYNTYLVAREDRGIAKISDLAGKKVGIIAGTITDFYLSRLLEVNGIDIHDVTRVDVKTAANSVMAIVNGDVDAIVIGQPYANSAEQQLGSNAFFQSAQSDQSLFALAVATKAWISKNPELVSRFLRALSQADEYLNRNSSQSKVIVEKELNYSAADLETYWPRIQFGLSLSQALVAAMEDEGRWMIANNMTTQKQVPNFDNYIFEDGLKTVKPESVNIIE